MPEKLERLRAILLSIERRSLDEWLFLPRNASWDLDTLGATLELPEVPPHLEDDPEAEIPEFSKQHDLKMVLDVATVQDIVVNLGLQVTGPTIEQLFEAFLHYYDHDAFMVIEA